ncbi:MAG: hypothetical protein V1779_08935 [bacterium]
MTFESGIIKPFDKNAAYQELWQNRKQLIEKYLPVAKFINNSYQHRRNIWRNNVKKRISRFVCVPDWFVNMESLAELSVSRKLRYNLIESKPNPFQRIIAYIKKLF